MATTTATLASNNEHVDPLAGSYDAFDIDIGSGSTWTRIASGVGGMATPSASGSVMTNWVCPLRVISPTDQIRITMRIYGGDGALIATKTATTAALGAVLLNSATWTFTRTVYVEPGDYYEYDSDTVVANITYSSPTSLVVAAVYDAMGQIITRVALQDGVCSVEGATGWTTVKSGATLGVIHDILIDTYEWTISIDGETPVAFTPFVVPILPLGELKFQNAIGVGMFGQISYE